MMVSDARLNPAVPSRAPRPISPELALPRRTQAEVSERSTVLSPAQLVLASLALFLVCSLGFVTYLFFRYSPIIGRIFEETPMFFPLRVPPDPGGEDVRFKSVDGLELVGTYLPARTDARVGVMVFCHEYLGDRWSFRPYVGDLRDLGFDIFTFDFRNHGESATDPSYQPLQWVTDHEVRDLAGALAYLRTRPDRDPAGVGLFGVSRGGGAALCVAAGDPGVWGVLTDGAFATRGTMWAYMHRWAEIYIHTRSLWRRVPAVFFNTLIDVVGYFGRWRSQWRLSCRFPDVEKAVARIAPRPWLMIHGEKDAYIGPEIAQRLFAEAGEPKQLWLVPGAKHNRCREVEPEAYRERVLRFVSQYAPRRAEAAEAASSASPVTADTATSNGSAATGSPTSPLPAAGTRHKQRGSAAARLAGRVNLRR